MTKERTAILVGLLAFVFFAGPGFGQSPSPAVSAVPPTLDIPLKDSAFHPGVAMVQVNQTVRWTNRESFPHDVTALDGSFNSTGGAGALTNGATYEHAFSRAGVYDYYCTVHSTGRGNGMWARLIVVDAPVLALAGGGGPTINPEEIGVKWLAHWVGIASFVAVLVTLLIYYFVLKYGESVHTTDHRDRKEK